MCWIGLQRKQILGKIDFYENQGFVEIANAIKEEYSWHIDGCLEELKHIGFETKVVRFADLSLGISAKKAATSKELVSPRGISPTT